MAEYIVIGSNWTVKIDIDEDIFYLNPHMEAATQAIHLFLNKKVRPNLKIEIKNIAIGEFLAVRPLNLDKKMVLIKSFDALINASKYKEANKFSIFLKQKEG